MISPNQIEVKKWFADNGDNTHIMNHNLDKNSIVMDLGAYTGVWGQHILNKFNCNLFLIEPIWELSLGLTKKFMDNDKVFHLVGGISNKNEEKLIYLNKDGSSTNSQNGESEKINCFTFSEILNRCKLEYVDLLQMNIEGDEYDVLDEMIESGSIEKVRILQIQFHNGIENDIERRDRIQKGLIKLGYNKKYDYPFVWESWEKKK